MKIGKLKGKVLASLLACAMMLSITACGDNGDDAATTVDGSGQQGDTTPSDTTTDDTTTDGVRPTQVQESIDFGVISFNSGEVTIPAASPRNLGSNPGGVGYRVVRIAGFQGQPVGGWVCEDDPDGEFSTIISQNGKFWENIDRIEGTFYFDSDNEEPIPANVQPVAQGGGLIAWSGWDYIGGLTGNLLSEFDTEDGSEGGYTFGTDCVFKVVWDIGKFANANGSAVDSTHNPDGKYLFDSEPIDVSGEGEDPSFLGGGINQFGITVQNNSPIDELTFTFNWTGVTIYVKDLDLFNEFVEEVEEALGYKSNGIGKVVQI